MRKYNDGCEEVVWNPSASAMRSLHWYRPICVRLGQLRHLQSVIFLLMTPYSVLIAEEQVKMTGLAAMRDRWGSSRAMHVCACMAFNSSFLKHTIDPKQADREKS